MAALFGLVVGVLKLIGARWVPLQTLMPVAAAFIVSALTFLLANQGWANANLRTMIPPLVTFLPGAALTMSVIELSAAQIVSGASRLVSGGLQLVLLAFGIVSAAEAFGLPSAEVLVNAPQNLIGWWAPWLGMVVFGIGVAVFRLGALGLVARAFPRPPGGLRRSAGGERVLRWLRRRIRWRNRDDTHGTSRRANQVRPSCPRLVPSRVLASCPGSAGLDRGHRVHSIRPDSRGAGLPGNGRRHGCHRSGVLCGYLLVDSVKPLYRHTVRPALDLLPFQLMPSNWDAAFGEREADRGKGKETGRDRGEEDA